MAVPLRDVDVAEWNGLVVKGREHGGNVHAEEVALVLRDVELTGDVLDTVRDALHHEGIDIDESVETDDDTPDAVVRPSVLVDEEADEHLLARRRP